MTSSSSMPMPKRGSKLSRLAWTTAILGVAAFLALTIGRVLAVIALISVIGIPIYFLLAAIPTAFLICFLAFAIAVALKLESGKSIALALALSVGVMVLIPVLHNRAANWYVNGLVKEDRTPALDPWSSGTIALAVPEKEVWCGHMCQQMLARGLAQRFIVATAPNDARGELDLHAKTKMYSLEPRRPCNYPWHRTNDPVLRLKLAQGACLVEAPAELAQADAILWHRNISGDNVGQGWLNPLKLPAAVTRVSLYRRRDNQHAEVWRETSVRYSTLFPVLIPSYVIPNGMLSTLDVGLMREIKTAGVKEVLPPEAFLRTRLQLDFSTPEITEAAWQEAAVDNIVRQAATPEGPELNSLDGFSAEFDKEVDVDLPLDRVEKLLNAAVRNGLSQVPFNMARFTRAAYRKSLEMGDAVADAMVYRLNEELKGGPDRFAKTRRPRHQILQILANGVDAVPDERFARLWPRLRPILRTWTGAEYLKGTIRRAWLTDNPTEDLLAAMDLQQRYPQVDAGERKNVLHAAMSSLCTIGVAGTADADALPAFAARVQTKDFLPDERKHTFDQDRPDGPGLAHTLAALGADRDFIRRLRLPPDVTTAMEPEIEPALRKPICSFK